LEIKKILITGGAGFVGSSLSLEFKQHFNDSEVIAFDNLKRRGSELTLERLRKGGVRFVHGDVRSRTDLAEIGPVDLVLDCAAEPSVMAGVGSSPDYVIETNLGGTINLLEYCRLHSAKLVFLSTSRVYPFSPLNSIPTEEKESRFCYSDNASGIGYSCEGIAEDFPLSGARTMYGSTKLCSELLIEEYREAYGLEAIINRCGVLAGPWQMGKVDQGFIALWVARHFFEMPLSFIGFDGSGKQVRDILHVKDLFALLKLQLADLSTSSRGVWNVGGGTAISVSLRELTDLCSKVTGKINQVAINREQRPGDLAVYITDSRNVSKTFGWQPKVDVQTLVEQVYEWIKDNQKVLEPIFRS
jgi:CDP-paratose 2-epimerase